MKCIDKLFLKFAAYYGPVWRSQLKQDEFILFMKKEWHKALAHFSNRIVELAIEACGLSKSLPPTLPEFVDICKNIRARDGFIRAVPSTKPKGISNVGKSHLAQIKKLLNGSVACS
ncbi:hypothetical protein Lnau_0513 [Legionella nautarum]|uniref:Legionella vir region protein n=1 Tax=Legionella nautarum TaxID=45070 RepID=A0A0W0X260_9GAMM|nr:hypothetical protein [Legionella nautarum]KTD38598.1 hypothetical protein Lnau_0513 [Legionella nautarum]